MAQPYKSRVAETKEELLLNNSTPGAKGIAYYVKPGGFKCTVNGCEFRELVLLITKKNPRTGQDETREQDILEGELVRPDGTRCWVYQGMQGWIVDAHNAHAMQAMVKTWKDGEKTRREAAFGSVVETVKTMRLANLPNAAIIGALKGMGVDSVTAQAAVEAKETAQS